MAKIVIIGGGLTGLSAAYHLEQRGFFDYEIYEKDETVGGLCRSVHQDGFTFDYTGHLLHVSDDHFRKTIENVVGFTQLNTVYRKSFIYSNDLYTKYPYQINLHGLPINVITECIEGYVLRQKTRKKNISFYDWVLQNFGTGFAKHFFFPFQSKIFDYNIQKISAAWTGRFVPATSLEQMIDGALHDKPVKEKKIGYNAQFFYPKRGGINYWVAKLAQQLHNKPRTGQAVTQIDMNQRVLRFSDGSTTSYEVLINTMPLDVLLRNLKPTSSFNFQSAARKLLCNSVVNFNLGFNRPDISDKHWIYFPESKYPFYRLGFPHNFSEHMAPAGCSSLYGELSYLNKTQHQVNHKLQVALKETKKLLNVDESEIVTEKIINIPHAYVIHDFWREKNLPKLLSRLKEGNIHSIGRYGEWKYSSMQEALLDGKKIAETLTIMPAKQAPIYPKQVPTKQKELA